jgi:hypothetical protein
VSIPPTSERVHAQAHLDPQPEQRGKEQSNNVKTTKKRGLKAGLAALGLTLVLSACTPEQISLAIAILGKDRHVASDASLTALRRCESGDNYGAVSGNGRYRGAYQFNQGTWNGVASRNFGWLVGMDPAGAAPFFQDAMARALIRESGRSPWPHCGRYL